MSWVAVDRNGLEYVYEIIPIRLRKHFIQKGESESVNLPNGSIEKLIGRQLTWDDEPVELKEAQTL